MDKEKGITTLISVAIVLFIAAIIYFQPPFFSEWVIKLENDTYDREVRRFHQPLLPNNPIAIVAIDDRSITQEGKWPWDRTKMGRIAQELDRLGASVIAYDLVFSEPEANPVDLILAKTQEAGLSEALEKIRPQFDPDAVLAGALEKETTTLGFVFSTNDEEVGVLPPPLFVLTPDEAKRSLIPEMKGYLGNQPLFQRAAERGGFLNTTIDKDGILRFSPLLLRKGEKVYPSLGLKAAKLFLKAPFSGVSSSQIGDHLPLESIRIGERSIPTDPWGRILIPFRGTPGSFPSISATDLLQGKVAAEQVKGKLIFIGLTATASSDLVATAISPVFPGVEVQASIASGIIDGYLPHKPNWGRGMAVLLVLILGLGAAILYPRISRMAAFVSSALIIGALHFINQWLWTHHSMVLSFFFPMPTLITLFILDLVASYISDVQHEREIKRLFGQTVLPSRINEILEKRKEVALAGEMKEVTFLCIAVPHYETTVGMLPPDELKNWMNRYFSAIDPILFERKGTVDSYRRDQVVAMWGAPLSQPNHPIEAVEAALEMVQKLADLKIPVSIGIDTGTLFVGNIGSKFHSSYTGLGKVYDRTLELNLLAQQSSIPVFVGESTKKLTEAKISYKKIENLSFNEAIYQPTSIFVE